jgi:hypothetical protein
MIEGRQFDATIFPDTKTCGRKNSKEAFLRGEKI